MHKNQEDSLDIGIKLSRDSAIMLMEDFVAARRAQAWLAFAAGVMTVIAASFMPRMFAEALGNRFDSDVVRQVLLGFLFVVALFEFTFFLIFLWMAKQQQQELEKTNQDSSA